MRMRRAWRRARPRAPRQPRAPTQPESPRVAPAPPAPTTPASRRAARTPPQPTTPAPRPLRLPLPRRRPSLPEATRWVASTRRCPPAASRPRCRGKRTTSAATRGSSRRTAPTAFRTAWSPAPDMPRPMTQHRRPAMMLLARVIPLDLVLTLSGGCAQTTVTEQQTYQGPRLARPDRIIVYDFAASAADLPPGYTLAVSAPNLVQTQAERNTGQQLGAEIAKELVSQLQAAGLPAVRANIQSPPRVGDITIVGYFVSVDSGNIATRFAIGFGSGAADLKTVVEV